jgi:flavin-dependent dehydrogenase
MPKRATKRGAERTPLERDCDVLICGASFAGLSVARELAGSGAKVLMIDRYEIGERQTSACAAPTEWLANLGIEASVRQTFDTLVLHTPFDTFRYRLPWTFSTFDYPQLCALLREQSAGSVEFETAKVEHRGEGDSVVTDRGVLRAPLIVDALGWRRVLAGGEPIQPPDARLSRGLEVHPAGAREDLEIWIDPRYIRAGYSWSFPAGDEVRVGVGSFEPRDHVKQGTVDIAAHVGVEPLGYQGNWIPHQLRPATGEGVFFAGDSAGHCLPLTAEGIRTAFYFGLALGRELRLVVDGRSTREQALARYAAFSAEHAWQYRWMLNVQHLVGRTTGSRALSRAIGWMEHRRFTDWAFTHYLNIAHPSFVQERSAAASASASSRIPAAMAGSGTLA